MKIEGTGETIQLMGVKHELVEVVGYPDERFVKTGDPETDQLLLLRVDGAKMTKKATGRFPFRAEVLPTLKQAQGTDDGIPLPMMEEEEKRFRVAALLDASLNLLDERPPS